MMKRMMIPLLAIAVLLLALAPGASAACVKCKIRPEPHTEPPSCVPATQFGWQTCIEDFDNDTCILGPRCSFAAAEQAATPLASEFTLAAVERLDDAQPAAGRALVASLDLAVPATR